MNALVWLPVGLLTLTSCKGSESASSSSPSGSGSAVAPKPVDPPALNMKVDPAFVLVDRHQLDALCLASRLPRSTEQTSSAALVLKDGTRVPWLTFTVNEEVDQLTQRARLPPRTWIDRFKEVIELAPEGADDPDRMDTRFRPCVDRERTVIVSGVFVQKDGFHLIAARGKRLVEKHVPPTTSHDEAFATAFALIEQLVGQPVTIAQHQVTSHPTDNAQPTMGDERWTKAAAK